MNPELMGMSNDELIQWACKHGAVSEKKLRKAFPDIELFCAQHPVGIGAFIEVLDSWLVSGVHLKEAIKLVKGAYQ